MDGLTTNTHALWQCAQYQLHWGGSKMFAGIAAIIGAIIGGIFNHQTNQDNKGEAQKNRDFQAQMSNTSHQRQVADLRAAGLNPILSANSGASTPSGAQANMQQGAGDMFADAGKQIGQQSYDRKAQSAQIKLQQKQEDGLDSQIATNRTQAKYNEALTSKARVDAAVAAKDIPVSEIKNRLWNKTKEALDYTETTKAQKNNAERNSEYMKGFRQRIQNNAPKGVELRMK